MGVRVIVKSAKMRVEGRDAHPDEFALSDSRLKVCVQCEHYIELISGYSFMMEQWGYKLEDLDLYHIRGNFNESGDFTVDDLQKHPIDYLLKDTIKMFNHYKYNRNAPKRTSATIVY